MSPGRPSYSESYSLPGAPALLRSLVTLCSPVVPSTASLTSSQVPQVSPSVLETLLTPNALLAEATVASEATVEASVDTVAAATVTAATVVDTVAAASVETPAAASVEETPAMEEATTGEHEAFLSTRVNNPSQIVLHPLCSNSDQLNQQIK